MTFFVGEGWSPPPPVPMPMSEYREGLDITEVNSKYSALLYRLAQEESCKNESELQRHE